MKDYERLAIRTENQDFEGISKRLIDNKEVVTRALNKAILAAQELDAVVKKNCFYGKNPKYSHMPLFDSRSVVGDEVFKREGFIRLLHGFMGITTEAGEGLEAIAKEFNGESVDMVNIAEELGDVFWYGAVITDACHTSFNELQNRNIAKLSKRYRDRFNDIKSMERDLVAERQVLSGAEVGVEKNITKGVDAEKRGLVGETENK